MWTAALTVTFLPAAGLALAFLVFAAPGRGAASGAVPFRIVLTNDGYTTLAVDHRGVAYGTAITGPTALYRLYSSTDEGQTWTPVADFPTCSRVTDISVLSDDTLLAHVNNCSNVSIYRSADHGATWTPTFTFPQPVVYRTLTPHSITDDGHSVYIGSYNTLDDSAHENWVWRSDDDGQTWHVVMDTTTHRHIHFVQADPTTHWVYVGFGDSGLAEIDVTRDQGATWSPLCTGDQCLAVDMAFDPSGFALFGQDVPYGTSNIQRVDLATGAVRTIMRLPGISYSSMRLRDGVWLIGTAHGVGTAYVPGDLDVHLFASIDGGQTFSDVYDTPYTDPNSYALKVQFAYPNGDFPIQATGGGTVVAHIDDPPAPTTTTATTTTTGTTGTTAATTTTTTTTTTATTTIRRTTTTATTTATSPPAPPTPTTTPTSTTPAPAPPSAKAAAAPSTSSSSGGGGGGGGGLPPDLRVAATADAKTVAPGQNVTFSIDVSLMTAGSATGIILDVHLPENVALLSTYANRGAGCRQVDASNLRCDLDWLSPPLVADVVIGARVDGPGPATLTATVAGSQSDVDPSNNSTSLTLDAPATPPPAITLALLGSPRVGHRISVRLTGAATGQTYRWQTCSKSTCKAVHGAQGPSLLLRRTWKGLRLRVIVQLSASGVRQLLMGETPPIT